MPGTNPAQHRRSAPWKTVPLSRDSALGKASPYSELVKLAKAMGAARSKS